MANGNGNANSPGVTRRTVLRWTGVGLGSLLVAGATGVGIRGAINGAFSAGAGDPYELWSAFDRLNGMDRIVAAGVLACNPHNTQPWLIDVGSSTITIFSDASRRMPVNDASAREHFAGLGCAIENMVVAARAQGTPTTVTLFPNGDTKDLVATIELGIAGSASARDSKLAAAIPSRHTNRGPYEDEPVSDTHLDTLAALAAGLEGASVTWVTERAARASLGALYIEATEAIIGDTEQSGEAFSWFRNDRSDIDRYRDGLTLDCQGLDGVTLFLAKVLPAQSRTEGDQFWVKSTREVHTATAAAYGIVTVEDVADRTAQVTGGRLLGRLHLGATSLELGFHHMNQITERIDRDIATGSPDVFSQRWGSILGQSSLQGLVSFRLGHAQHPGGLSPRRALADVVKE